MAFWNNKHPYFVISEITKLSINNFQHIKGHLPSWLYVELWPKTTRWECCFKTETFPSTSKFSWFKSAMQNAQCKLINPLKNSVNTHRYSVVLGFSWIRTQRNFSFIFLIFHCDTRKLEPLLQYAQIRATCSTSFFARSLGT